MISAAVQNGSTAPWLLHYVLVVMGVLLRWVWELAAEAAGNGGHWKWEGVGVFAALVVLALILALFSFLAILKAIEEAEPSVRALVALTQGMAMDALAGPAVQAASRIRHRSITAGGVR